MSEENSLAPQPIETLQLRCEWIEEPSFAEPWAELDFSDDSISCIAISLREKPPKAIGFAFPDMPGISLQRKLEPSDPEKSKKADESRAASTKDCGGSEQDSESRKKPSGDAHTTTGRFGQTRGSTLLPSTTALGAVGSDKSSQFSIHPIPYQFEGIAFLFPRAAAILADEMGLGKTMQAISTIRMLLMAGELSSVLLICPKPLVTNWVREFHLWAPEIPVAVIEGDQARRQFLWQTPSSSRQDRQL